MFLFYLLYIFLFLVHKGFTFDLNIANISVWLSSAAYCDKELYPNMTLSGPASGFKYIDTLYDLKTDTQGFIGYHHNSHAIYVVIRGTSSALNWLDNIQMLHTPYLTYPECACNVHSGFYKSALSVKDRVLFLVQLLHIKYPTYRIINTGHSLGAAISSLLAMEIVNQGLPSVEVYNFGQPRVGDALYAGFVNTVIDENHYWRITHNQDIVPHLPVGSIIDYMHSCREVFELENGDLIICSEIDCEDTTCANKYPLSETNIEDHHAYLGHVFLCES